MSGRPKFSNIDYAEALISRREEQVYMRLDVEENGRGHGRGYIIFDVNLRVESLLRMLLKEIKRRPKG